MNARVKIYLFVLLVVLLVAAVVLLLNRGPQTGITGQALLLECSGDQVLTDCFEQNPYQATFAILDNNLEEVKRFTTDSDGNFTISLEPGFYILQPVVTGPYPIGLPQEFQVLQGRLTELTVAFDSGIR
ncbi:MAG: hypothetical protein JXB85_02200 [Anaerolineales bacterium]|nr:hypothetical protein [Anaerolineales bacterium]